MAIRITTQKIVDHGVPKRKIIEISGLLDDDKIPYSYFKDYPTFIEREHQVYVLDTEYFIKEIRIGDSFNEDEFHNEILENIRLAGERMHECRKAEKKLKATFKGKETFII